MEGIAKAVAAHDFPAVAALLKMLAATDPAKAHEVYGAMTAVLDARQS